MTENRFQIAEQQWLGLDVRIDDKGRLACDTRVVVMAETEAEAVAAVIARGEEQHNVPSTGQRLVVPIGSLADAAVAIDWDARHQQLTASSAAG